MRVSRRPAVDADRAFLEELNVAALGAYAMQAFGSDEAALRRRIREDLLVIGCDVVLVDDREAGCLTVEDKGEYLFIATIALLPDVQRRGIGTMLVAEVMARAEAAGVPLRLNVLKVNPARSLYQRLGFYIVGADAHRWLMQWP